jgi:small subunit ribosomal protein S17
MRQRRKVMQGRVIGDKMEKTVVVEIESSYTHPLYGKVVRRANTFKAHNVEPNLAKLGDLVKIIEARPYSHDKRWLVSEIVQRGVVVEEIREVELEGLRAKEDAERAERRADEERRAAARLSELAGEEEEESSESPTEESEEA